jgi:hypothetical protein
LSYLKSSYQDIACWALSLFCIQSSFSRFTVLSELLKSITLPPRQETRISHNHLSAESTDSNSNWSLDTRARFL